MPTFLKTKEAITAWLEKHHIEGYELITDETYGFVVNVKGDVYLNKENLLNIPVKFNQVDGDFYCNHNKLTSLEFSPSHVDGHFWCNDNQLNSLEFCPVHVGGHFNCDDNPLLQDIQNIKDFKQIYQHHQATKIRLAKERLEEKLSDQPTRSSQPHAKIKI